MLLNLNQNEKLIYSHWTMTRDVA